MPREPIAFTVPDLSSFARALARNLAERDGSTPPTHVEMLNLVARAAGHRNVQALRATRRSPGPPAASDPRTPLVPLTDHARRALRLFDADGRLVQWPGRFAVQRLAMWILWTRFEARRTYTEKDVNEILKRANAFGDHVTLRRELVNHHLLERKSDCSEYRRCPARPDPEARALLGAWRARQREATAAGVARR